MPVTYRPSLRNRDVIEPPQVHAFAPQHAFKRLERRARQALSIDRLLAKDPHLAVVPVKAQTHKRLAAIRALPVKLWVPETLTHDFRKFW